MNQKLITAEITSIEQVTPKIKTFRLYHGRNDFLFQPGQWIDLYAPVEGKNIGGYTITSSAHTQEYIDLAVRESLHHPVTKFLHNAVVGRKVEITMGQGKFFLTDEVANSNAITFIAGGIGLTPILSMIRSVDKKKTPVQLFYSVSNEEDIIFRDELAPVSIFSVTKKATVEWKGETKRIDLEMLKKYKANFNSHFFICGPRAMIDSVTAQLKEIGVPAARIHFEKWW